jgi:hypothetical protein
MSDASWNLQVAIYSLLKNANPSITGGRIYDDVPEAAEKADAPDTEFPYVAVGELDVIPDDVDASNGSRDDGVMETLTLHVWSRYHGQKEVKQIMQQIKNLLHDTKITVTDRSSALAEVTMMRSFIDQDGKTRHGVVTVEVTHRS